MTATDWAGLAADFLTLAGGIILAWDAVLAVGHFKDEQRRIKTFKSFAGKVRLETEDKQPIRNEDDVHLDSLKRVAFWATLGSAALILGYALQLMTRLLDIWKR